MSRADDLAVMVETATVIKPGDRVLVTVSHSLSNADASGMTEQLMKAFPGVDFAVLTGVSGIAVDRQDETEE